ncbi:hypothetical protein Len3610_05960 [Lentibacillus sp. CBA3610]|nr:hypothetical protein Len3610_05960 [Lentibacillus sp. CBA3610]
MSKTKLRTLLACWLLILILCSNIYIAVNDFQLAVSYLVLCAGAVILHTKIAGMIFHVFGSFTIMIGYAGIFIFDTFTPLKLFFPSFLIISCILFMLITLITTGLWNRLACVLLGMAGGELLYNIVVSSYFATDVIGDKRFFDFILVVTVAIICQDFLLTLKQKLTQKLHKKNTNSKPLFRKQAQ